MKYIKASTILPEELLLEIQKYANGQLIYIPKPKQEHIKWGAVSGGREITARRNAEIKETYQNGMNVEGLAEKFCLSVDSIRKIVYGKT